MKKIFFFILFTINFYGQINSANIKYSLIIGQDEKINNDQKTNSLLEKAQQGAKNITFSLIFNKNESLFKIDDFIEDENSIFAKLFSNATNIFYTEANSEKKIKQIDGAFGQFIVKYSYRNNWVLENETKMIDTYLCYKATSELVVVNSKGEFKFPIVAWYCPSIPFSFGPKGYDGLPGLILELQERFTTYGVLNIKLNNEDILIERPNKGKIVTEEEFNEIIKKPPSY